MVYTEDGAVSWRLPRLTSLQDGMIQDIEVNPSKSCEVYVAKGEKLFKSTNCMRTFDDETYVETRAGIVVSQVAIDWYTQGVIWIGLSNGDILKSVDDGASWKTVLNMGGEISSILLSSKDSRQVIISSINKGMQRTIDAGDHWEKLDSQLKEFSGANQVFALTQTIDGGLILAATKYGLLRSTDDGASWDALSLLTSPGQVVIYTVAVAPKDPNTMYYATPGTFYRTSDGGQTWQTKKFPSTRIPRAILVDPQDASVLYVGVAAPAE